MAAKRSTLLEPVNTLEAVKKAWNYPVFDAIFQRRALWGSGRLQPSKRRIDSG